MLPLKILQVILFCSYLKIFEDYQVLKEETQFAKELMNLYNKPLVPNGRFRYRRSDVAIYLWMGYSKTSQMLLMLINLY